MPRRFRLAALALAAALGGCLPSQGPGPILSWDFDARPTEGEVRVVPVVVDVERPAISGASYVGAGLTTPREHVRRGRTEQLAEVPAAIGLAFPGSVGGALGDRWTGSFRVGAFPLHGQRRLRAALDGRHDLDATLGVLARQVGGDATLFVWVDRLHGAPLSAEGAPGDLVHTEAGSVVVDHGGEPYRVVARVGMALVAADGDVVLRYRDVFEAVLSDRSDATRVGRELARGLAHEVAKVWPCDPRLVVADAAVAAP